MIWISYLFVLIEPISAFMLAMLVLRYREQWWMTIWVRITLSVLVVGLLLHAGGHIQLIMDYRPPRTLSWVLVSLPLNVGIWLVYFMAKLRDHRPLPTKEEMSQTRREWVVFGTVILFLILGAAASEWQHRKQMEERLSAIYPVVQVRKPSETFRRIDAVELMEAMCLLNAPLNLRCPDPYELPNYHAQKAKEGME